jgi:methylenetetrahydrofolate dehydrogenase (NADP+)/methenyltetrahydrofolate cyclohydrolase
MAEATIIDGKAVAAELRAEVGRRTAALTAAHGIKPGLATVLVGDDPASRVYVRNKVRQADETGLSGVTRTLGEATTEAELVALVAELNADPETHGILVQLPLPGHIDANAVIEAIDPDKDVDGLTPINAGRLLLGEPGHRACTPLGIMKILEHYEIPIEGAHAVVIGRSAIVGKPISLLLQQANATVTMCHSRTKDLAAVCRSADILVAAVGVPRLVQPNWVKPGAAVIDVGVSAIEGELVGDVDTEGVGGIARIVTPHRRGVGPMTITMLLCNTLDAYEARFGA